MKNKLSHSVRFSGLELGKLLSIISCSLVPALTKSLALVSSRLIRRRPKLSIGNSLNHTKFIKLCSMKGHTFFNIVVTHVLSEEDIQEQAGCAEDGGLPGSSGRAVTPPLTTWSSPLTTWSCHVFSGIGVALVSPIAIWNKCLLNICADLLPFSLNLVQFSTALNCIYFWVSAFITFIPDFIQCKSEILPYHLVLHLLQFNQDF